MRNPSNERYKPLVLTLQHSDPSRTPSTVVYTGKLDWLQESVNEMITLVIPSGTSFTNGSFVGMYHQWTVDSSGNQKGNHPINSTFDDVETSVDGNITGTFGDGHKYTYEVTILKDRQEAKLTVSDTLGHVVSTTLKQTDFRGLVTKKVRTDSPSPVPMRFAWLMLFAGRLSWLEYRRRSWHLFRPGYAHRSLGFLPRKCRDALL